MTAKLPALNISECELLWLDQGRSLVTNDDMIRRRELRHSILAYLLNNPMAEDTIEGIAQWWILSQKIQFCTDEVEDALDELVDEGFITLCTEADSKILYRLNKNKYEEIELFLNKFYKNKNLRQ